MKRKFIRGSTASVKNGESDYVTNLDYLAEKYSNYGNVPKSITDIRAILRYRDLDKNKYPRNQNDK